MSTVELTAWITAALMARDDVEAVDWWLRQDDPGGQTIDVQMADGSVMQVQVERKRRAP